MAKTPDTMKNRLQACGVRSRGLLVDISNYVMLELGHPLHFFDRDKISGAVLSVRQSENGETIETLDGKIRQLESTDTVIYDEQNALALAGIMGGGAAEVGPETTSLLIEVANWRPSSVRQTSARLGLRTEASQRYEKSLDDEQCLPSLRRAVELVLKYCPEARVRGNIIDERNVKAAPALKLQLRHSKIEKLLGLDISLEKSADILRSLEFETKKVEDGLEVSVPSFRATKDIEIPVDLVEEIGRVIGYAQIPPVAPLSRTMPRGLSAAKRRVREILQFLVGHGQCYQVMTYPLISNELLEKCGFPHADEKLALVNSLSQFHQVMRPSVIPGLLEKCAENAKNFSSFQCFELGRVYRADEKAFSREYLQLGMIFYSRNENLFLSLANTLEKLLSNEQIKFQMSIPSEKQIKPLQKYPHPALAWDWKGRHPKEGLDIQIMGKSVGAVVSVHPFLLKSLKIKGHVALGVVNFEFLDKLKDKTPLKFQSFSKLPAAQFDCSVVLQKNQPVSEVFESLKGLKDSERISEKVVTVFPLSDDQKSVTLQFLFQGKSGPPGGDILKQKEDALVSFLETKGFPLKGQK